MSKITIRIDGNRVTLTVDGRESVNVFADSASAQACYEKYKAKIDAAELAYQASKQKALAV